MWRPTFTAIKNIFITSQKEISVYPKLLYSTRGRAPRSTVKITLVSASVGVLIGAGYGGYTHYKVNSRKKNFAVDTPDYAFFKRAPEYKPNFRVVGENDTSNLQLVLFQYRTCPFCCKVRAYLDYRGVSYELVEVDAVLRQAIQWSGYKKVPILLAKVDGGYQQLLDSTAIVSVLETYMRSAGSALQDVLQFYPPSTYVSDDGKNVTEVLNKYFIMHNAPIDEKEKQIEGDERLWRQWTDEVLVHVLSPNVYRSPEESLQAFRWFADVGHWYQSFPAWECSLMVYGGAFAMWLIAKRLKARHKLEDDVRQSLYEVGAKWAGAVKARGTPFLGGEQPGLADLAVFGALSSIEGCNAFQDLRDHTDIGPWFDATKAAIDNNRGLVIVAKA